MVCFSYYNQVACRFFMKVSFLVVIFVNCMGDINHDIVRCDL